MCHSFFQHHILHCCLVPAISSHSVTHCARCRLVCFIVLPRMHAVVQLASLSYVWHIISAAPLFPFFGLLVCFIYASCLSVNKCLLLLRVLAQLIGVEFSQLSPMQEISSYKVAKRHFLIKSVCKSTNMSVQHNMCMTTAIYF